VKFVFENFFENRNLITCADLNRSGIRRFTPSPIATRISMRKIKFRRWFLPKKYIISSGVAHHPINWTNYDGSKRDIFSYLNSRYLKDLRCRQAMLLLDQSHEGYQTLWLWEYFHKECLKYDINPRALIYVTGNLLAEEQYQNWASANNITDRICVIPYAHFEKDVEIIASSMKLNTNFDKNLSFKKTNLSNIKLFSCLNKRLRSHRAWFYTQLVDNNLNDSTLISMNKFTQRDTFLDTRVLDESLVQKANKSLPALIYGKNNNEEPDGYYINRIRDDVCLDSWFSVVSEASFGDNDGSIFISEKTFKPIACMHPFIILGNRGSLVKLRDMGYKTFDGFIDETYDTLPTFERMDAIISSIRKISAIEDKLSWFESMRDILEHNQQQLIRNTKTKNSAVNKIEQYYAGF
jgi:hypothetical protein